MAKRPADLKDIGESKPSLASRLAWLVLIWGASVVALAAIALIFRLVMGLAGLTA
ncbi:DUF2474 domain-containing protein [Mycobacterium tuberculosis]|nr:DUF2474 domain-containing protein [Mycobacterium tuberculosis]MBP0649548.1 DUF2474 domain-containing protein [Mycobacterium tuberculosis]